MMTSVTATMYALDAERRELISMESAAANDACSCARQVELEREEGARRRRLDLQCRAERREELLADGQAQPGIGKSYPRGRWAKTVEEHGHDVRRDPLARVLDPEQDAFIRDL